MAVKILALAGSLLGFLGVALGAFGAHGLRHRLGPDMLAVFETGVRYQMYHAVMLWVAAWALDRFQVPLMAAAGWAFLAGTLVFSGSLYILVLSGVRAWGAVTPVGGLLLLTGWAMLAWSLLRIRI